MEWLKGALFGTPKESKPAKEVVEAPEFEVTQYAKKLVLVIGIVIPAVVAGLQVLQVEEISEEVAIAALGVVAVALLSVSLVMSADMLARAIATQRAAAPDPRDPDEGGDRLTNGPLEPGEERTRTTEKVSRG